MSIARRLLGTSALVLGGSVWSRIAGAAVVLALARHVGREALGNFSFVQSYVTIVMGLAEIGLVQIVVREIARGRPDAALVVGNALMLRAAIGVPVLILAGFGLFALSDAPGLEWMALAGAAWVLVAAFGPLQAVFRARIQMGLPVAVNAVASGLYGVLGLVAVFTLARAWPVYASFALTNAAALGVLAWSGARRLRPELRFDPGVTRALLAASLPLALNALLMVIYHRVDQVMLQAYLGAGQVGIYASAVKLVEVWNVVPLAVMTGVFPALSRFAGSDRARYDDLLRRTAQLLATVVLGALPFVWRHGATVLVALFGEEFRAGSDALVVLMAAELFLYFLFVFRDALVSDGLERVALLFSLVTMLANVALNVALIPRLGILGAAWATLLALASVVGMAAAFASTRRYARVALAASWRPSLAAAAAWGALAALAPWPVLGVPLAALAFAGALVALGAFDATDRALVASLWSRVRRGR